MNIQQFSLLNELEQQESFWKGIEVGARRSGNFVIECRQIDDFYIEYHVLGGHYINIRCFKNPDFLEPYLENINIDFLSL